MRQLRPLTIPMLLVTLICLVIVNTAGYPWRIIPGPAGNSFGWPFTYLMTPWTEQQWVTSKPWVRVSDSPMPAPQELPVDSAALEDFSATAFWQNVLVAITIAACVAMHAELAQRMLFTQAQFGLRQLFAAFVVFAVVLVASRSNRVYEFYCCHWVVFQVTETIVLFLGGIVSACIAVAYILVLATRKGSPNKSLHPAAATSSVMESQSDGESE